MDEALDAQTWSIVIGVVLGFFAVPAAMLAHDLRRRRRIGAQTAADSAAASATCSAPVSREPARHRDITVSAGQNARLTGELSRPSALRHLEAGRLPSPTDIDVPRRG